jgi:uncharacterized FAD-dependent dehydrogenase
METYDCIIVGTGPSGLGAAFYLSEIRPELSILLVDKSKVSTGGLRNDCKMNFTFPVGFPLDSWQQDQADLYLDLVGKHLNPEILAKKNLGVYQKRARRLNVDLLEINQAHLGTDGGLLLIEMLMNKLAARGVRIALDEEVLEVQAEQRSIVTDKGEYGYGDLVVAPGRGGFRFLQKVMDDNGVSYIDNIVDIGIRVETRQEHYPIVKDYYDPKFYFPEQVRTFCTNSGCAHVVRERYTTVHGQKLYSVNGHAYSKSHEPNGLVNFAVLKTVALTEPLASGQEFAEMLGLQAMLMGGGRPIMQRVGDFRLGKRSKSDSFSGDLYDFEPTLKSSTAGDISLAMPAKVLRAIWNAMKKLDTIIPGVLHPSTIMYYPEIKLYANRPQFADEYFRVQEHLYLIGDGAGTSRGITGAWASGIRAAKGILEGIVPGE